MKRTKGILLLIIVICLSVPAHSQKKEIIGYFPSWTWKSRDNLVDLSRIPYHKLTFINYAFFYPLPDGTIVGRDATGDSIYLYGVRSTEKGEHTTGAGLTDLAHQNGVKVMLSVGGWADSYNFPEVAGSALGRSRFAHSCIERIKEFRFDGIDIDWEYPGYVEHKGTPQDAQNFTSLLQTIRDSLNGYGKHTGQMYLLTAALPANFSGATAIEVRKIAPILDQLNIMTYDFSGPWDSLSNHNSPLYPSRPEDSTRNVDAAFRLYHDTYGVPAGKINLGVPFYAHTFSNCTSLHTPHTGSDTVHFSGDGNSYHDIVPMRGKFTRYWDDRAKAPYLVNTEWKTVVSYDDEESVRYKAQYVVDENACGLIIWEITGDYMPDRTTPLLDCIYATFYGSSR